VGILDRWDVSLELGAGFLQSGSVALSPGSAQTGASGRPAALGRLATRVLAVHHEGLQVALQLAAELQLAFAVGRTTAPSPSGTTMPTESVTTSVSPGATFGADTRIRLHPRVALRFGDVLVFLAPAGADMAYFAQQAGFRLDLAVELQATDRFLLEARVLLLQAAWGVGRSPLREQLERDFGVLPTTFSNVFTIGWRWDVLLDVGVSSVMSGTAVLGAQAALRVRL
jgi:hypothetical protein